MVIKVMCMIFACFIGNATQQLPIHKEEGEVRALSKNEYKETLVNSKKGSDVRKKELQKNEIKVEEKKQTDKVSLEQSLQEVLKEIDECLKNTSQIKILHLNYEYPILQVDLSKELVAYRGGNEMEHRVVTALLKWGFETTLCEQMDISIEGSKWLFPEGSLTSYYTREDYQKYYQEQP